MHPPSDPLTPAEVSAWLRFAQEPGLTPAVARALLHACASPTALYDMDTALPTWLPASLAQQLRRAPTPALAHRLAQAQTWLAQDAAHHLVPLTHPAYPTALRQLPDAPLLLYLDGCMHALAQPALAIVGARDATPAGRQHAQHFAQALAEAGWLIVSGLARGIDAAAHEGALAGALDTRPATIAVFGCGPDIIYPRAHGALAQRIRARGVLLSDYPPGTPPLAAHFPQRNRLVAGLSAGTLVIEAATRSGSLITARLAADYGREVFALPGAIHAPQARGCLRLIQQGAKLVVDLDDILSELPTLAATRVPTSTATPPRPVLSDEAIQLLACLDDAPATLDDLRLRQPLPTAAALAALWTLEQCGLAARTEDGRYQALPTRPAHRNAD